MATPAKPANVEERFDIADVVVDVKVREGKPAYSYAVPPDLDREAVPGVPVVVSFHGQVALGYVVSRRQVGEEELPVPRASLKPLLGVARGARLSEGLLHTIRFAAEEYVGPLWLALHTAVPRSSRSRMRAFWQLVPDTVPKDLREEDQAILAFLEEVGGEASETSLSRKFGQLAGSGLARLRRRGVVRKGWEVVEPRRPKERSTHYLVADVERLEQFLAAAGRKRAQADAVQKLMRSAGETLTASEIAALGLRKEILAKLVLADVLMPKPVSAAYACSFLPDTCLGGAQATAVREIASALETGQPTQFLLHGVTASGKTEVYLRAISQCLRLGKTAVLLVPEIALTDQVVRRVQERFGDAVCVLHSGLAASERFAEWQRVARGDTPIVVGPRSAIFAPLPALGLILIDEEHDASYKQANLLRYDARGVAAARAMQAGAVLVRGSATPCLESYFAAREGGLRLLSMPERASGAALPPLEVVDLRQEGKMETSFGRRLVAAVEEALSRGEQVVLFLNRRAYAPYLLCRECGFVQKCERCSVSLSFHRRELSLKCHHCDFRMRVTDKCPRCGSTRYRPHGLGTQRVEEDCWRLFPQARVGRLDRDVKAHEEVLSNFRSRNLDILVGTQMVAKGLDFPSVSLVGIMNADTGLNIPDFRASERTFQLLVQVAGRAGRAEVPGRVIAQTFDPEHPAIRFARSYDYAGFVEYELESRKAAGYPPFRRLAQVVVCSDVRAVAVYDSKTVGKELAALPDVEVLGPADAVPEMVMGVYRRLILVKFPPHVAPGPLLRSVFQGKKMRSRLIPDVDPQTLA